MKMIVKHNPPIVQTVHDKNSAKDLINLVAHLFPPKDLKLRISDFELEVPEPRLPSTFGGLIYRFFNKFNRVD